MFQDKTDSPIPPMPSDVIKEARTWVNTPYQHQAMVKGVGVDCVGLIVGVGLQTGALRLTEHEMKEYSGYGRLPNPRNMEKAMKRHLVELALFEMKEGDIAWLQWRQGLPMHLALVGTHKGNMTLLHALGDVGKVVEHTLTPQWDGRIVSFWRYPELF